MSLRRIRADGAPGDLLGFVVGGDSRLLRLRDRHGVDHDVRWSDVRVWRAVGVARGRDPRRTPLAELDRLAGQAGLSGRSFVIRLSDLLDGLVPPQVGDWSAPPPLPARLQGEWVSAVGDPDPIPLGWWATHHDARSLQLRTADDAIAEALLALGFTQRR